MSSTTKKPKKPSKKSINVIDIKTKKPVPKPFKQPMDPETGKPTFGHYEINRFMEAREAGNVRGFVIAYLYGKPEDNDGVLGSFIYDGDGSNTNLAKLYFFLDDIQDRLRNCLVES